MKRNFILSALAAGTLFCSCADFFEPENSSVVFEDEYFQSATDVNAAILGVYAKMQNLVEPIIVLGDVRSDLLSLDDSAPFELKEINALEYKKDNKYLDQTIFFDIVGRCDEILENMEQVRGIDAGYTEAVHKNFTAELKGIRAWTYFQIARIFGSVEYGGQEMDEADLAEELYAELFPVIADFSSSMGYTSDWARARMNQWAMYALCGELLMTGSNFTEAAGCFESIMQASGDNMYKVTSTFGGESWSNIFMQFNTAQQEVIWGIDFNAIYKQYNDLQRYGENYFVPVKSVTDSLFRNDPIRRKYSISEEGGSYRVLKYSLSQTLATPIDEYADAAPLQLYRAADIHLLYAECMNHTNRHDYALQIINQGDVSKFSLAKGVRGRLDLAAIEKDLQIDETDKLFMIDSLILNERGRELAYEGKRWYDLVRFSKYHPDRNIIKKRISLRDAGVAAKLDDEQSWYVK